MPLARITEYYPATSSNGHSSIVCREATAPRDLASMILLWAYCCFAAVQVRTAYTHVHNFCYYQHKPEAALPHTAEKAMAAVTMGQIIHELPAEAGLLQYKHAHCRPLGRSTSQLCSC
jgi:hypothetical protein